MKIFFSKYNILNIYMQTKKAAGKGSFLYAFSMHRLFLALR